MKGQGLGGSILKTVAADPIGAVVASGDGRFKREVGGGINDLKEDRHAALFRDGTRGKHLEGQPALLDANPAHIYEEGSLCF